MPAHIPIYLAGKLLIGHAAAGHAAAGHAAAGHAAAGHAAAAHAGLTTILGTPIAASAFGGITFLDVYKNLVDDVYDQVKLGLRPGLHLTRCARLAAELHA